MPRAILFDMDGTLTQPIIDFAAIKHDIGLGNGPILEAIVRMNKPSIGRGPKRFCSGTKNDAAKRSTLNRRLRRFAAMA